MEVKCGIPIDHSVSVILSERFPPELNNFVLFFDFFTVSDESIPSDECLALRCYCDLYLNNALQTMDIIFKYWKYFAAIFCAGIQNKLLYMGFSLNALTIGVDWNAARWFYDDSHFYIKIKCNKQLKLEYDDPYYRWAING